MNTDTRLVSLTQDQFAIVDSCDYDFVNQWKWYASKVPTKIGYLWYVMRKTRGPNRKTLMLHRVLAAHIGLPYSEEYDHRDNNPLNNARSNLRPSSRSNQRGNTRKSPGKSSRHKGVSWAKDRLRWRPGIKIHGKRIGLGDYVDEDDAGRAYDVAAKKYFGAFARLNFPDENRIIPRGTSSYPTPSPSPL